MSSKRMQCSKCSDDFATKYNLKRHLKVFHKLSDDEIKAVLPSKNLVVQCHMCEKKVSSRAELVSHLRTDHQINSHVETNQFQSENGN